MVVVVLVAVAVVFFVVVVVPAAPLAHLTSLALGVATAKLAAGSNVSVADTRKPSAAALYYNN